MALFGPSKLTKQMDASMQRIQNLGIAPEMEQAYQKSQSLGNMGMDAASMQLAIQEQARGQNLGISALKGRRSVLAGLPGLAISSSDFATRLAAQNAMMKRDNMLSGIQTGMQFGQAKMELDKSKAEAQYNALAAKKQARQQLTSSIIGAVGAIGGAALSGGVGAGGSFLKNLGKSALTSAVTSAASKGGASLFGAGDPGMNIPGSNYGKF